jgi:hypothetical protein
MKLNRKYIVGPGFESLFSFKSKEEELDHNAQMLSFNFLSEFEKLFPNIKKKELAVALGTSPSYITQLFQGDKLINLITLAKLQEVYG